MSFFEQLSKIAETVNDAATFVQGIKSGALGKDISNKVSNSILKSSPVEKPADPEDGPTTVTLNPSIENSVPVLYGTGFSKGTIVDAALDADDKSLWISFVLSERTGTTIAGVQSEIFLEQVLIDGYPATFDTDGIHITDKRDSVGNIDTSINQLIEVYYYNNGSENQSYPLGYTGSSQNAYSIFPGWGSGHVYGNLVFAIVKITYDQENDVTSIPEFTFKLRNTLTEPGDVLHDYLLNTRYGAGVPQEEVRSV